MSNETNKQTHVNTSDYYAEKVLNITNLTVEEIEEANERMLTVIRNMQNTNPLEFEMENLHWDSSGQYDIKFGEYFRKNQEINMYSGNNTIAKNPELNKLAKLICVEAIRLEATDIQIMKINDELGLVRLRVGQEFIPYRRLHGHSLDALATVFKFISNCNVDMKTREQGGRFAIPSKDGKRYDMRTSFLPTLQGENVSIRVLYSSKLFNNLENLNLPETVLLSVRKVLKLPEGLILLTGGTGSGKTTTLYTCLNEIARNSKGTKNIITLENPVEYTINGVVQSQIDEAIGYTFAKGLQTILRQNPDIILVGEINDSQTAQTATRASTSGHLVFSTLHTNDVLSVSTSMDYYGVSHFQLSWALQMVINQRLVNRLCPHCKELKILTPSESAWIKNSLKQDKQLTTVYQRNHNGCEHCEGHGYIGRVLVCSMLDANKEYTELAMKNLTLDVLEEALINNGNTNYYPIEKDVFRHLDEGNIDLMTANTIVR